MYDHLLNQTITITRSTGTNDLGDPIYGASEIVKARVTTTNTSRMTGGGEVIPIHARINVNPTVMVDAGDKVSYRGTNYRVEQRNETPDASGVIKVVRLDAQEWV